MSVFKVPISVANTNFNSKIWGTVLFRNVRMNMVLLTANCEVFALDKYVVKANVDDCVFGCRCYFLWWGFWICFIGRFIPVVPLYPTRPVIEIQIAESFRLFNGVDNSHSCTLLLTVPASLSPDCRRLVGEPGT